MSTWLNGMFFALLLVIAVGCRRDADFQDVADAIAASPIEDQVLTQVSHLDATGAAELLRTNEQVVVLDVRTPEEYAEGHLAGAINVDFKASDFVQRAAELDRETPYVVHCLSGGRSTASLDTLRELGFVELYHLDGGMNAWEEAGQPVEK